MRCAPRLFASVRTPVVWIVASTIAGPALAGDAVDLDGVGDRVELGLLNPGTSFTVETWVTVDDYPSPTYTTLFEAVDPTNHKNSFYVGYVSGSWQIEIEDINSTEVSSCTSDGIDGLCYSTAAATGTNFHIAVVREPTQLSLYVDGVLVDAEATTTSPGFGAATWVLGADDDGSDFTSDGLDGRMDEVRIWDQAQSAADIACLRDYALTGTEDGLYAYYDFGDAGTTATDGSGNGWHGTLEGDAQFVASPFTLTRSVGGDIGCYDFDHDGQTPDGGDCVDTSPTVYQGAPDEFYDGMDSDCAGDSDFDADVDGFDSSTYGGTDCDDGDPAVHIGAPDAFYDGVDSDCSGDDDFDADGDGYASDLYGGDDCDDTNPNTYPGAPELVDGLDDDCDRAIDEDSGSGTGLPRCGCGASDGGDHWSGIAIGIAAWLGACRRRR